MSYPQNLSKDHLVGKPRGNEALSYEAKMTLPVFLAWPKSEWAGQPVCSRKGGYGWTVIFFFYLFGKIN